MQISHLIINKRLLQGWTLLFAGLVMISSCKKDYLGDGSITEGTITDEQLWANDSYARGILNEAYNDINEGFNLDGDGAMLASGSDEAVNSNQNSSINIFNNGTWSPVRTVNNVYDQMYEGIRKTNLVLENIDRANIIGVGELTSNDPALATIAANKDRIRGQAYFLRAWFHFELLSRYGSIVIATRTFRVDENLNLPRNSYDECVTQIVRDCDSAIALLPSWTNTWSTTNRGRATKMSALAIKSRLYLYAASPLNNPGNDLAKWQLAANVSKMLIDSNYHSVLNNYYNVFNFGSAQYNAEVIFSTKANNRNDLETNNAPIGFSGAKGRTDPTQELVDAFEMTNGRAITDPASGYNPSNPYNGRDPRFALVIHYNGRSFKGRNVETFVGGQDGLGRNVNATKTGYYMRKFLSEAVTWNVASVTNARRPWIVFRYAEILLNAAEALNEAQGPVANVYTWVNRVRARTGIAMPALPAGLTQAQMRERIRNERRVELCFEGHRFFDIRRWKLGEQLLRGAVTGMRITQTAPSTFSYERFVVENRVFDTKNYLFPFAQSVVNRAPAITQNPGY